MRGKGTAVTLRQRLGREEVVTPSATRGPKLFGKKGSLGPDPSPSYIYRPNGQVAQLVEQRTENPRVGGSIPSLAIHFHNSLHLISL